MQIKEKIKDFKERYEGDIINVSFWVGTGLIFLGGYYFGDKMAEWKVNTALNYCILKDPTLKKHLYDTMDAVNKELTTK